MRIAASTRRSISFRSSAKSRTVCKPWRAIGAVTVHIDAATAMRVPATATSCPRVENLVENASGRRRGNGSTSGFSEGDSPERRAGSVQGQRTDGAGHRAGRCSATHRGSIGWRRKAVHKAGTGLGLGAGQASRYPVLRPAFDRRTCRGGGPHSRSTFSWPMAAQQRKSHSINILYRYLTVILAS